MTRLLRRLRYLLQRDGHERALDDELQFHLEMKQQELESRGVDRATAAATARRALGICRSPATTCATCGSRRGSGAWCRTSALDCGLYGSTRASSASRS